MNVEKIKRIANAVTLHADPLPERVEDLDEQTRRKVEMEARWRGVTPAQHLAEGRAANAKEAKRIAVDEALDRDSR